MAFDDLADETDNSVEEADPGDEALGELAGTLSDTPNQGDSDADTEDNDSETTAYDPSTEPVFPTAKNQTQHSVYCLPRTWDAVDGPSGLLFEAEIALRRNGYGAVQKRELHNAFLQAAVNELSAEDIVELFVSTRNERVDGPLLDD